MSIVGRDSHSRYEAPFMSLEKFEDLVFSAGGDIRNISVIEEYEERKDSMGCTVIENETTRFEYLPGLYDDVAMPLPGETAECGHVVENGSALVGGHSVCDDESGDCERNAVTVLRSENEAFLARNDAKVEVA